MQTILIVSKSQGYMLISLKDALVEAGYQVVVETPDIDSLGALSEQFSLVMIFSDEKLLMEKHALIFLKDKAIEEDLPVYVIGDNNEIDQLSAIIPKDILVPCPRPIKVNELTEQVDEYLKESISEKKRKILVVDDSGTMLRCIKSWLSDKYQVILANSGAMAIKYLVQNNPDLILLDYEMPVCDGKQVLEMIRSESEFDNIPVMFLTSKGDRESVMKVMSLKPDGYLLKTMAPTQIVESVDNFFEKRKAK